jgi:integrin alpha FG-GAP repeat containing protein 1
MVVITADFNNDGNLDVLLQIKESDEELIQKVYLDVGDGYQVINLPLSNLAQPLAIDYFGNFTVSLFGQTIGSKKFSLWTITENGGFISNLDMFKGCSLADPHANAWVDLNGDCKAGMISLVLKFRLDSVL